MDYLLEVGTEEIPARFVDTLLAGLSKQLKDRLAIARIRYDEAISLGSYRRLALIVKNIAENQDASMVEVKGPPLRIALNEKGDYTPAGLGFLKKNNQTAATVKDGYLVVTLQQDAKPTDMVLGDLVSQSLEALYLPVAMHWGNETTSFVRPVHWIVSLLGNDVLPLTFAGQVASRTTSGHRFLSGGPSLEGQSLKLSSPANYIDTLRNAFVLVDPQERKQSILDQVNTLYPALSIDHELLDELVHLVEYPTLLKGRFDPEYLAVPERILVITMKKHQKYIPVTQGDTLTADFLITADNVTPTNAKTIIAGNERVVRARLHDARFYYEDDISKKADHFLNKLKTITYQQELGSIADKVARNKSLAMALASRAILSEQERVSLTLLVDLSKFDLATAMVIEFTELQGYVGEQYALKWGIAPDIAQGISSHYKPSFSGDSLPTSRIAKITSVTDKLDTLVGHFALGHIPSGSFDPYALRRQANGILLILFETSDLIEDVRILLDQALANLPLATIPDGTKGKLDTFLIGRLTAILRERGLSDDMIKAIITLDLPLLKKRIDAMKLIENNEKFEKIVEAAVRVANITKALNVMGVIDETHFQKPIERKLWAEAQSLSNDVNGIWGPAFFDAIVCASETLSAYFDEIMVMDKDISIQNSRLGVLKTLDLVFSRIADFRALRL